MQLGGAGVTAKTVYHDGRDWVIEKREGRYWCVPLDADEWQEGLPSGMTVEDLNMLFTTEVESTPVNKVKELQLERNFPLTGSPPSPTILSGFLSDDQFRAGIRLC
jgi:hypothetical protein